MAGLQTFVLETCNAPGSNALVNLGGAPTGRVSFAAAFSTGGVVFYFMDDGTQAEWGAGTFTVGAPNTISRDTVLGNTAGTLNRLTFSGSTRIYNEVPASRLAYFDAATGNLQMPAGARITGLSPALAGTDGANLGQVSWGVAGENNLSGAVAAVAFAAPSGSSYLGLEFWGVAPSTPGSAAIPSLQLSYDGGNTWSTNCSNGSGPGVAYATGTYMAMGRAVMNSSDILNGRATGSLGSKTFLVDSFTYGGGRYAGFSADGSSGAPTNLRFIFQGGSQIATGSFRCFAGY